MSASAREYAYRVTITDTKKPEPIISQKSLEARRKRVEQYLQKDRENAQREI